MCIICRSLIDRSIVLLFLIRYRHWRVTDRLIAFCSNMFALFLFQVFLVFIVWSLSLFVCSVICFLYLQEPCSTPYRKVSYQVLFLAFSAVGVDSIALVYSSSLSLLRRREEVVNHWKRTSPRKISTRARNIPVAAGNRCNEALWSE